MNSDTPQKRFEIEHFVHGLTGNTVEVIADLSTYAVDKTDFGTFRSLRGYTRHVGREFVGYFGTNGGEENAVYGGTAEDVIFMPLFKFDGDWQFTDRAAVRETSGTGRLWRELEDFWQAAHRSEAVSA